MSIFIWLASLYHELPDADTLRDVKLQVPLRIFSADNKLMAEFGEKRRIPVDIEEVPPLLLKAFIATEDRRFYDHGGVDLRGLLRAAVHLIKEGNKGQGGSTITMQVARNFFLSRAKTYSRKLNEILLAIKIERELSKDEILALYLNKVFLGYRAYGVAAAAEVYYGKPLSELSLAQYAMIAGLPKAPSAINPLSNPKAAEKRRKHVLARMLGADYITEDEWEEAVNAPLDAKYHGTTVEVRAPYVAEMVRTELLERFGPSAYTQGLQVYTTIDSDMQKAAYEELRRGLMDYDQRHGLRKIRTLSDPDTWLAYLDEQPKYGNLESAVISEVGEKSLTILRDEGQVETIPWKHLTWARRHLGHLRMTKSPAKAEDIAKVGDVVFVYPNEKGEWRLGQVPEAEGAIVSLAPKDGRVLALVGGFDFTKSKFNRVTQAELQPGSNFKPFVYTAALASGFNPTSIINDSPVVFEDPADESLWRPQNDNRQFAGPTSLRTGLIRSRNLVSIRLLNAVGLDKTIDYVTRFGFEKDILPQGLSLALGTANLSPLQLARGYAIIANGGYDVEPNFIERVEGSMGEILLQNHPATKCERLCASVEVAESVVDPRDAYIMTNLLQDAIKRGTGRGAKSLGRSDIAGKTGTTNDQFDAWFSGFNADIVTSVWVGFDSPKSLGEYASRVALPIWREYMARVLKDKPEHSLPPPSGVVTVKIDPETGLLARSGQADAVFEVFRLGQAPTKVAPELKPHGNQARPSNIRPDQIF